MHNYDQKEKKIVTSDIHVLMTGVDRLLEKGTTKEVKHLYQCFIKEITFNKKTKSDIQMTVYFDEGIVNELNKNHQEAISEGDMAVFVSQLPIKLTI